jgi:Dockerin type I domain
LNVNPNKTIVGVGQVMYVDVLISNTGDYTESVNPHCYANGTSVIRMHVLPTPLNSDYCKVFRFAWNTTGFAIGVYSMSGTATPVANETHTSDNTLIQGLVTVSVQGDLSGDFTVDIYDAIRLAGAYNSNPSRPNWNANADINNDAVVDIFDAILLAGHFNQHYP